jgi:hypothetical protein
MRSDKDEVFRFIWENRDLLELRDGAYTEVLSVRPSVRTGIDGFVVRETVAEYYQGGKSRSATLCRETSATKYGVITTGTRRHRRKARANTSNDREGT